MKKRILALVMASILLLGSVNVPLFARAEDETVPTESTVETTTAATEETTAETTEATEETIVETTEETTAATEETTEETTAATEETTEETEPEETIPEEPDSVDLDEIYYQTADTLISQTPRTGSTGGEWLVLGLARAGELTDSQKEAYLEAAKTYIGKKYDDAGKLHKYKPTENERLALALTSVGQDAADFCGYDLLKALGDTAWTTSQGNNASAFALLAYNAAGYDATNTDALIQSLLDNQNKDGGWAITSGKSDSDTTAMVVQALAPYYSRPEVKPAVDKAMSLLAGYVNAQGQISAGGYSPSVENTAQVIVALTEMGIDPVEDIRFIRNGRTLLDGLISFYVEDAGGFAHEGNESYNQMATEQAFYALVSWYRLQGGENSLYDMSDVVRDADAVAEVEALIAAIGEVTANSGAAIDAARKAYDDLSDEQKGRVTNYDVLLAAEEAYADCIKTAEDEAAADAVERLIEAIGTPVTLDSESSITTARKAYDALNATQKTLVGNYTVLTEAEATLKAIRDELAADEVEDLIDEIGTVTLNCEAAIKEARNAYDALTKDQKKLVENYQTLLDAESVLAELKSTISVKFTLLGCWEHGEAGDVHTLAAGNLNTWIKQKTYKVSAGATVQTVFEKALGEVGMTWENPTDNYVESIDGIGEFTNGNLSGWMYTLNGTHPNLGVNQQKVKNGDVIVFHYTDDYTREEGSSQYQTGSTNLNKTQNTQNATASVNPTAQMPDAYALTGDYLENLGAPGVGSVGGEWMVIGLARSGRTVADGYYDAAAAYISEKIDENGRLHRAKSTDNSRMILALTAIGKDVTNVHGHNLLRGLTNMDYLRRQGINGPIWALIAFDSGNYPIPDGDVSREKLVKTILEAQLADGGWALSGEVSDPDMTGMALQALAKYQLDRNVMAAAEKALDWISETQNDDGSWSSIDGPSSESVAQVVVALTALGVDPVQDARFIKNGNSAMDALLSYFVEGGGFRHTKDGELDGMATEQSYYALASYQRFLENRNRLYDMTDVVDRGGDKEELRETVSVTETAKPESDAEKVGKEELGTLLLGICAGIGIGLVLGIGGCITVQGMWIWMKKHM